MGLVGLLSAYYLILEINSQMRDKRAERTNGFFMSGAS